MVAAGGGGGFGVVLGVNDHGGLESCGGGILDRSVYAALLHISRDVLAPADSLRERLNTRIPPSCTSYLWHKLQSN